MRDLQRNHRIWVKMWYFADCLRPNAVMPVRLQNIFVCYDQIIRFWFLNSTLSQTDHVKIWPISWMNAANDSVNYSCGEATQLKNPFLLLLSVLKTVVLLNIFAVTMICFYFVQDSFVNSESMLNKWSNFYQNYTLSECLQKLSTLLWVWLVLNSLVLDFGRSVGFYQRRSLKIVHCIDCSGLHKNLFTVLD